PRMLLKPVGGGFVIQEMESCRPAVQDNGVGLRNKSLVLGPAPADKSIHTGVLAHALGQQAALVHVHVREVGMVRLACKQEDPRLRVPSKGRPVQFRPAPILRTFGTVRRGSATRTGSAKG